MKLPLLFVFLFSLSTSHAQTQRWVNPSSINMTLNFPNYTVMLQPAEIHDFEQYYLPNSIIDSLTEGYFNSYRESLIIEEYLKSKFGHRFKREKRKLHVKLNNGEWLPLEINPNTDEADHVFEYYFEKFGFYSIRTQWSEGNTYKLVHSKTGEITDIMGRPYFSPDGSKIIALGNDIEANYSPNGFEIWENHNGKLNLIGSHDPERWGCKSALWLSHKQLILKNESYEYRDDQLQYFEFFTELKLK